MKESKELQLSQDLNVITAEINSYKQVAGQAIFEIGRRLKHVKENDLVHGEFGKWLESIEINQRTAQQMMKIASDPTLKTSTYTHLGTRALYEIATIPQEEREKEHILSSGEVKQVDEMTVRELQEVKRKLKEIEQAKEQAEKQAKLERKERERLEQQEPKVVVKEVVVEVDKTDYTVISGHQRLKACEDLGIRKVPVIIREDLDDDDDKLRKLLAANFGRVKNDPAKQRRVAVEYVELVGLRDGEKLRHNGGAKTQKEIADDLGISERDLQRLLEIERKLTPEIKELLDDGIITKTYHN